MSLMRVDLPICDIHYAPKACLLPVPVRPGDEPEEDLAFSPSC
jgi:hypothetical protein